MTRGEKRRGACCWIAMLKSCHDVWLQGAPPDTNSRHDTLGPWASGGTELLLALWPDGARLIYYSPQKDSPWSPRQGSPGTRQSWGPMGTGHPYALTLRELFPPSPLRTPNQMRMNLKEETTAVLSPTPATPHPHPRRERAFSFTFERHCGSVFNVFTNKQV